MSRTANRAFSLLELSLTALIIMVVGGFGRPRHCCDEVDSGEEIPELKSLGDHISAPAPARESPELSLNRDVR